MNHLAETNSVKAISPMKGPQPSDRHQANIQLGTPAEEVILNCTGDPITTSSTELPNAHGHRDEIWQVRCFHIGCTGRSDELAGPALLYDSISRW